MSTDPSRFVPGQRGITPVDPDFLENERALEEKERRADCPELLTFIKRTTASIRSKDSTSWDKITDTQVRCIAYYDDRQYGTVKNGQFHDARIEPGDIRPIDNRYKVQIDKLAMEIVRSLPKIEVSATDTNDTQMAEAAKFAQYRINTNRDAILRASERQREAQALLLKMMTYRYVFYNPKAKGAGKERRVKKEKRQYGETRSIYACAICAGPTKPQPVEEGAEAGYKCPNCGSSKTKTLSLSSREREVVTGYEEVDGGRVESQHVDPMMVRVALSARQGVVDSPFLWWHQSIFRCILEAAYPEVKIRSASSNQENTADQYQKDAQSAPSNSPDADTLINARPDVDPQGGDQLEECPFDLYWIDPVMYRGKKFSKPQRLLGGRELPANVDIESMFPDGMCIAMNGDDNVLDIYPEDKNKKWLFCVYGIREHALHGSGTTHLLGPQDTRNDLKALLIANTHFNATPREFIRDGAVTGNRLPNLNEVAIIGDVPPDKALEGWGYAVKPGTPLPNQAMELYESENGAMQEGAGTASLSSEGTDTEALSTAFGVKTMRDQAVGRMGPNLMLMTEMEEEWGYLVLEHELENFSPERFLKMANQAITAQETEGSITYTADGIRTFLNCDPRTDLKIKAAPGSWMPRTEAERAAAFAAFAQFAAVVAEKMATMPAIASKLLDAAATAYGVEGLDLSAWTATEMNAAARIRALAETVSKMERRRGTGLPTEQNVAEVIMQTPDAAINNEMDNHILFIGFYRAWWASDEGQSCSPLMKKVIEAEVILHRQGEVYQRQEKAKDELAAEAPKAIAAQETAAAAQASAMEDAPPKESINYKDAPPTIRRQMEQAAGYQPATEDESGTDAAAETAKVQGQIAVAEHKAELDADADFRKAQLQVDTEAAKAQIEEERAESDHAREKEATSEEHQHEAGMKTAEMMHDEHKSAVDRQHESSEKERDRKLQAQQNKTPTKK